MTVKQDREAYQQRMGKLRWEANQLRAAMKEIAGLDADFTALYGVVVKDPAGWDQMIIDLEALAGIATIEAGEP